MRLLLSLLLLLFCSSSTLVGQSRQPQKKARTAQSTRKTEVDKSRKTSASSSRKGKQNKGKPAAGSAPSTAGIRKLQTEQAHLKKQIEASKSELSTTRKNVQSQLANLQLLNGQISDQQRVVAGIQQEVDTLTHSIGRKEQELTALEEELRVCQRNYARGILYMHKNRLVHNKLMFVFAAPTFRQMYKRLRYIRAYTRYQRALGTLLQEKEQAVRNKRNELASARSSKHVLLEQGKVQQTQLQTRQKEQQGVVNQLNQRQRELQTTIARQQQQYNALNAKIDQLIQAEILAAERRRKAEEERRRKEEQRRQEAERARAAEQAARKAEQERTRQESARGSKKSACEHSTATPEPKREAARPTPPAAPRFNAPDNTDRRLSANFAANQGRLPVPITGSYTISCHFGAYNVDGLNGVRLDNKGINLTAPAGAQARCIFDGEVTAIFPMGGMSNIIVRHGSYISVYCNLAGVSVRRGQQVSTRQILGTVARDASGHCTLHFQLRHETTKLNPERWLGR